MKKISRIVGVATLLLLATAGPAWAAQKPGHPVPVKGTVLALENGQAAPVDCPAEAEWRFSSWGTGQMSHLGRVELFLTQCSYFGPDGKVISDGTTTFTAANGDELVIAQHATSQIVGDADGFTLEGTWIVADGSGRFAQATGSGEIGAVGDIPSDVTVFDLPVGATLWNFTGKIAYHASDRSG